MNYPKTPQKMVKVVKSPAVLYDKKYDKVIEIADYLNGVLAEYNLKVDCITGTYSPIDIQVHITEFGKSNL